MRYVETLKPGFYFRPETKIKHHINAARCFFITGTLKGNKWIDFDVPEPKWMSLSWTSINAGVTTDTIYYDSNPTEIKL